MQYVKMLPLLLMLVVAAHLTKYNFRDGIYCSLKMYTTTNTKIQTITTRTQQTKHTFTYNN